MTKPIVQINDKTREMTSEELKQFEKDVSTNQALLEAEKVAQAKREVAQLAAIAHAKSLGFTDDMIAVMYPNLGA